MYGYDKKWQRTTDSYIFSTSVKINSIGENLVFCFENVEITAIDYVLTSLSLFEQHAQFIFKPFRYLKVDKIVNDDIWRNVKRCCLCFLVLEQHSVNEGSNFFTKIFKSRSTVY